MVVYGHYVLGRLPVKEWDLPGFLEKFVLYSRTGVELFFVLSGFLIGGILLDNRYSERYFSTFYIRRFYRIVPLYAVVCLLVLLGLLVSSVLGATSLFNEFMPTIPWYAYATFMQNFWVPAVGDLGGVSLGVTWSLAVEEHFHLTLPVLVWLLRRRPAILAGTLVAAVFAAPVLRAALIAAYLAGSSYDGVLASAVLMPARADQLALGVLGAMMVRNETVKDFLSGHRAWLLAVMAVAAVDLLLPSLAGGLRLGAYPLLTLLPSRLGIFYLCLLLFAVLYRKGLWARVLRSGPLVRMGTIAYGAYILHLPIRHLTFVSIFGGGAGMFGSWPVLPDIAVTLLALALTLIVSQVSWTYFERPLIKVGYRHEY